MADYNQFIVPPMVAIDLVMTSSNTSLYNNNALQQSVTGTKINNLVGFRKKATEGVETQYQPL